MKIESVYLGTWFQRTHLHLREFYNFLENRGEFPGLDYKKLANFRKQLQVKRVVFRTEQDLDFVQAVCGPYTLTVTEDGVILLKIIPKDLDKTLAEIGEFYSHVFAPAISYLFSRGAPLPKSLAEVSEVYPLLLVVSDCEKKEVARLFEKMNDRIISVALSKKIEIYFGDLIDMFCLSKDFSLSTSELEELLSTLIFFREFEKQLGQYLKLHRDMWEEVSQIRETERLRYRDFPALRQHILDSFKTLSFVNARLSQMDDILNERMASVSSSLKNELVRLGQNRFEHLQADQKYISHLWQMTVDFVNGTLSLLQSLFEENTHRELSALKMITFLGVLTGFFGMNIAFPWEERWPNIFPSSIVVMVFLVLASFGFYYLLKTIFFNRRFTIIKKGQR